jgi:trehalose synthase
MNRVSTKEVKLDDYAGIVSDQLLAEVAQAAEKLKGRRIVHVNATPQGGGVAEILKSLTPLMCDIGINASWYTLSPDESFFRISKMLHHCLQGCEEAPSADDMKLYLANNEKAANNLASMGVTADLWLFHDVQVLPMLSYMDSCPGIWVCHIDTTRPNELVREMLFPYMSKFQMIVASMPEYFPNGNNPSEVVVFPPAIDPLLPKHRKLSVPQAREVLAGLGMDPDRPIISQVSRFDRWKDPWGVVDAYWLAKKTIPGLQLALVGAMTAKDDYDANIVLADLKEYTESDPDIHLFSDPLVIGDLQVNAFQSGSDIVLQKSTREGFGLTVAEAMWKGRPVIGGNCGGISHQIRNGVTGFLVSDVSSCANRIVTLLQDRTLADLMGNAGRESVRRNYLMPRLLRDYLKLAVALLDKKSKVHATPSRWFSRININTKESVLVRDEMLPA